MLNRIYKFINTFNKKSVNNLKFIDDKFVLYLRSFKKEQESATGIFNHKHPFLEELAFNINLLIGPMVFADNIMHTIHSDQGISLNLDSESWFRQIGSLSTRASAIIVNYNVSESLLQEIDLIKRIDRPTSSFIVFQNVEAKDLNSAFLVFFSNFKIKLDVRHVSNNALITFDQNWNSQLLSTNIANANEYSLAIKKHLDTIAQERINDQNLIRLFNDLVLKGEQLIQEEKYVEAITVLSNGKMEILNYILFSKIKDIEKVNLPIDLDKLNNLINEIPEENLNKTLLNFWNGDSIFKFTAAAELINKQLYTNKIFYETVLASILNKKESQEKRVLGLTMLEKAPNPIWAKDIHTIVLDEANFRKVRFRAIRALGYNRCDESALYLYRILYKSTDPVIFHLSADALFIQESTLNLKLFKKLSQKNLSVPYSQHKIKTAMKYSPIVSDLDISPIVRKWILTFSLNDIILVLSGKGAVVKGMNVTMGKSFINLPVFNMYSEDIIKLLIALKVKTAKREVRKLLKNDVSDSLKLIGHQYLKM